MCGHKNDGTPALFPLLILGAVLAAGCGQTVVPPSPITLADPPLVTFSEHGPHVAWAQQASDGRAVAAVDGRPVSDEYDRIKNIVFNTEGTRVAYAALDGGLWRVVADGRPGPACDDVSGPVFSPDGRRLAYTARLDDRWLVVVDETVTTPKGYGTIDFLTFSPDGRRLAYAAGEGASHFMVTAGRPGRRYRTVGVPVFSPDGVRLAYTAVDDRRRQRVVVDGREGRTYDEVYQPVFSRDGRRLVYGVRRGERRFLVVNGRERPDYPLIISPDGTPGVYLFGPQDDRLAFVTEKDGKRAVVVEGKAGPGYDGIAGDGASIALSSDGRGWAYASRRGEKWVVVVNGEESPVYEDIVAGTPLFSRDGRHYLYGALQSGKWVMVVDGRATGERYDGIGRGAGFSPDGAHTVFTAKTAGRWFVVTDGRSGPVYDRVIAAEATDDGVVCLAESEDRGLLLRCHLSYPDAGGKMETTEERLSPLVRTASEECQSCEEQRKLLLQQLNDPRP